MDPVLVASIVAVQSAVRAGRVRYLFGLLLTPQQHLLLVERITAIETQLKKQLIDLASARTQLEQLGIDRSDVEALLARWAAAIGKPTATGQLIPP